MQGSGYVNSGDKCDNVVSMIYQLSEKQLYTALLLLMGVCKVPALGQPGGVRKGVNNEDQYH